MMERRGGLGYMSGTQTHNLFPLPSGFPMNENKGIILLKGNRNE